MGSFTGRHEPIVVAMELLAAVGELGKDSPCSGLLDSAQDTDDTHGQRRGKEEGERRDGRWGLPFIILGHENLQLFLPDLGVSSCSSPSENRCLHRREMDLHSTRRTPLSVCLDCGP